MTVKPLDDDRVEGLIAHLLRAGVLIAALVVIGGAIPYLAFHPRAHVTYRTFQGEPDNLKSAHGIIGTALSGDARGIIQLGLLLLIATPIARVMFSAVAFAIEGDRMYVGFTLLVLAVLLYSLFGSFLIT
ncbi:MAG TPA: DUF1634 domain-containing protein [Terriglobales bacterium]|jgi:uncharacterized membrane protein|nr:DUF1634 domain-containing protein [Terriglobales bacterium]